MEVEYHLNGSEEFTVYYYILCVDIYLLWINILLIFTIHKCLEDEKIQINK